MLRKTLFLTGMLFLGNVLSAQTTYTHTLANMEGYALTGNAPFTFPATPNTMGDATLSFSWMACYQGGFGTTGIRVRLRTGANTYVVVHEEDGGTISCSFQARTATISSATLQQALAYGGTAISGDVSIDDACQPGVGCSFYNDPGLQNMTLTYTVSAAHFTSPDASVCPGQVVQFNDASINSPSSHQWSFPGGTPETSTLPSPAVQYTVPGNHSVTLTVVTADGESTTTLEDFVTVFAPPTASAGADENICEGASVDLQASGGSTYLWLPDIGLSSTEGSTTTASPEQSTTYTVLVTSAQGCEASDQVTVNVVPPPVPDVAMGSGTLCVGDTLSLSASGAMFYAWSPNLFISSNAGAMVDVWPSADQSWTVTGTDAFGCSGETLVVIDVVPPPSTPEITWADMVLNSTGANTYQWYLDDEMIPGANAQTWEPAANGSYTVEITDANGCAAMSEAFEFLSLGTLEREARSIMVYPQPASNQLFVEGAMNGEPYRLIDAHGRSVAKGRIDSSRHGITLGGISSGVYGLIIGDGARSIRRSVVVE
ncbi:MAG TPA: PKD domain-containing protein [Flavobacteriales bacterium]